MDKETLQRVAEQTITRYTQRFAQHGYDARSLGWGSKEQQRYRFTQTLAAPIQWEGRRVLDIGCGFGDYRDFLADAGQAIAGYQGWDVNPQLIAEATQRHAQCPDATFAVYNHFDPALEDSELAPVADIGVMLGVLNFNLGPEIDNYEYSQTAIQRAWALVNDVLIVDFISSCRVADYAPEPWIFYHDPVRMLEFALTLSPRITIKQDYLPIPQREFMLFIERE